MQCNVTRHKTVQTLMFAKSGDYHAVGGYTFIREALLAEMRV